MNVSYSRAGGGRAHVPEAEWLSTDGASVRAWRSVATAAGWFDGELTGAEAARLEAAVEAAVASGPPAPTTGRPGAVRVRIDVDMGDDALSASYGSGSTPDGPWRVLDGVLADLLDSIDDRASATITIRRDESGGYRLVHQGDEPLDVDLAGGEFEAVAWRGWYDEAAAVEGVIEGSVVTAGPGWSMPLEVIGLPEDPDLIVHVHARVAVSNGTTFVPVEVSYAPPLPQPD